jgi:hypothetical protein
MNAGLACCEGQGVDHGPVWSGLVCLVFVMQ